MFPFHKNPPNSYTGASKSNHNNGAYPVTAFHVLTHSKPGHSPLKQAIPVSLMKELSQSTQITSLRAHR